MRAQTIGRALTCAALFACAACAQNGSPRPPVASLKNGLTILQAAADWGMNAAFRSADHVVYVETRLGPETPEAFRLDDPRAPLHEIDVRYVDEFGNPFSMQRGGDTFLEPSWTTDLQSRTPVSAEHRKLDFQLAKEMGQSMIAAMPGNMVEHVQPAALLVATTPSENTRLAARAVELQKQHADAPYTNHWWQSDMYWKSVAIIGAHTAAYAFDYNYDTSSWDWSMNTCNHGTCAMSYYCYSGSVQGQPFWNVFTGDTTQNNYSGNNGACCTQYAWSPGYNQHNSNDDGYYEMYQSKYGRYPGGCADNGTRGDGCGNTYSCHSGAGNGEFTRPCCL